MRLSLLRSAALMTALSIRALGEPPKENLVHVRPVDTQGRVVSCARLSCLDGPTVLGTDEYSVFRGQEGPLTVDLGTTRSASVECRIEAAPFETRRLTVLTGHGELDFGNQKLVRKRGLLVRSGLRTETADQAKVIIAVEIENTSDSDITADQLDVSGAALYASTNPLIFVSFNFGSRLRLATSTLPAVALGSATVQQASDELDVSVRGVLTESRIPDSPDLGSPSNFSLSVRQLIRFPRGERQALRILLPKVVAVDHPPPGEDPVRSLSLAQSDDIELALGSGKSRLLQVKVDRNDVTERLCE